MKNILCTLCQNKFLKTMESLNSTGSGLIEKNYNFHWDFARSSKLVSTKFIRGYHRSQLYRSLVWTQQDQDLLRKNYNFQWNFARSSKLISTKLIGGYHRAQLHRSPLGSLWERANSKGFVTVCCTQEVHQSHSTSWKVFCAPSCFSQLDET